MTTLNDYYNQAQAYMQQQQAADPAFQAWQQRANSRTADQGPIEAYTGKDDFFNQWFSQLSPQQQQDYTQQFQSAPKSWQNRVGDVLKYAIPAAVGGAGLLGAAGGLGSLGGAGALGTSDIGIGGAMAGTGIDAAGAAGLTAAAPTAASLATSDIGVGGAMAGGAGATAAGGTGLSGLLGGLGSAASGLGNLSGVGSLLAGGAGLANALKSPATAATPDYAALANQQAQLNQAAADKALAANRPDQVDAAGNTLTWTQDPATGKWTQTQKLSSGNQALLDTSQQAQLNALRGVSSQGQFNPTGLTSMMDPVGNSKDIQDAWMNLLKPERDLQLNGEIQRLKNQGLTEDSPAFQRAMLRQNQADTDAQNKALIAGTSEYGNQFNRSLQSRQQGFGEYQTAYNEPMKQYQGLMGISQPQGQFGSFTNAQNPGGAQVYGAGQDQYTANLSNANAKNASSNNLTQGLFGLAGSIAKGGWGA